MSSLPDFTDSGYLPPGIHPATHDEIRERFVTERLEYDSYLQVWPASGDPVTRDDIFKGYERLIEALTLVGLQAEQWIGGSFISSKAGPDDLDLVSFCHVNAFEALAPELRTLIKAYFKGEETARHCHCDSYFVPVPPSDHQLNADFMLVRSYWEGLLGHDDYGRPKGIVARTVTPASEPLETSSDATAA